MKCNLLVIWVGFIVLILYVSGLRCLYSAVFLSLSYCKATKPPIRNFQEEEVVKHLFLHGPCAAEPRGSVLCPADKPLADKRLIIDNACGL